MSGVVKTVGRAVGSVGKALGIGGGGETGVPGVQDPGAFDLKNESGEVRQMYVESLQRARPQEDQARAAGGRLLTALEQQATGQAPSIADAQMRQTSERNLAQQLAAAQAAKGGNIAAQQRQLSQAQATAGRQLAQDSAIARLQEQQGAQQMLGQQALSQQQLAAAQAETALSGVENAILMPKQARQQIEMAKFGAGTQVNLARRGERSALMGGLLGAAGSILSDESQKKSKKPAGKEVSKLLDALSARQYEYKDASLPGAAPGKRYGIMAQDLEKSKAGKALVENTPQGKMINSGQAIGTLLAANAEMHKRIKKLEGKGKA